MCCAPLCWGPNARWEKLLRRYTVLALRALWTSARHCSAPMPSPPIGQTAALAALENDSTALAISHIAKVGVGAIAAQVSLAHEVSGADHPALEDRGEVFRGFAVLETAGGHRLLGGVIDGRVTAELAARRTCFSPSPPPRRQK